MRSILGMESSLVHVSDEDIVGIVQQWRQLHPKREGRSEGQELDHFAPGRIEAMRGRMVMLAEVIAAVNAKLSPQMLADLEVMFYLGRDRIFAEYYEMLYAN